RLYPALRRSVVVPSSATPMAGLLSQLRNDHVVGFFESQPAKGPTDAKHEGQLHVIVVSRGRTRLALANLSLPAIRALVTKMLANPADSEVAAALGASLFPEGTLPDDKGTTKVHLIPSPALAGLPFAALTRAGKHLAEQWVLAEIPSLSALAALRTLPRTEAAAPAVFADPSGDLSAARAEAKEVAERLGDDTRVFVGKEVTSEGLRRVGVPSVLHFALHSGLGPSGAWLGLADRQIFAGELVDWRLRAHVVVLASCASVVTRDPGQWGSLAASFLANGTPSVVGSLWSTKDEVNRAFVRRFYAEGGASDPAAGLAAAQRAWISEGRGPGDWGAYVVYGAADSVQPARIARTLPASRSLTGTKDRAESNSERRSFPPSSTGSLRGSSRESSAVGRRGP
ncbi:MAG TPA: CHAT domain-containing protein, partial [Polyangia bacterium]